jgi:uncharacterized OB-fold protein
MSIPGSRIRAAQTRARIERVIARLPEVPDERREGIEDNLFELGGLCSRCIRCGHLYRPYLERCSACFRRNQPEVTPDSGRGRGLSPGIGSQ